MVRNIGSFKGIFPIVLASLLWGTTGTVASFSPDISSLAIGAFSMGVGGLLLLITAHKSLLVDIKYILAQPKLLFVGAVSVAIYPLAFYSSMRLSGVAIGTVVSLASAPFFAVSLERLICKKMISRQWMLSFIVGAMGILLLAVGKEQSTLISSSTITQNSGILLGLIAGLSYANYSWVTKRLIDSGIHAQSAVAGLFGCAALILLPSLWFTGSNLFASATNVSVSLYMAIIPMYVGYLLFGYGLKLIDASRATLITLLEPLVATCLAVLIVGEKLAMLGWFGMGLLSICLFMQTVNTEVRTKTKVNV